MHALTNSCEKRASKQLRFSCLDHTFPVNLLYQLYKQWTSNLTHYQSSAVNRDLSSPLAKNKCSFDKKRLCVLILFSDRKVSIRNQAFTGSDWSPDTWIIRNSDLPRPFG